MVNLYVSFCRMSCLGDLWGRITCRKWLQLSSPPELGSLTWTLSLVLVDGSTRMSLSLLCCWKSIRKEACLLTFSVPVEELCGTKLPILMLSLFLTWRAVWREEMQSCDHRLMFKDWYHDGSFFFFFVPVLHSVKVTHFYMPFILICCLFCMLVFMRCS